MRVQRLKDASFAPSFGIAMAAAGPLGRVDAPAAHASWGRIAPGGETRPHRHDEAETFVILAGRGVVETADGPVPVHAGDVVVFEPFEGHVLRNDSDEELVFSDLYWRDPGQAAEAAAAGDADVIRGRPVFVFSTPPTPNGDLHIGHLSGPYLAADVYTRFQRMNGAEAYHVTGSDDFQSYVVGRARDEGTTPEAVAAHYAAEIEATLGLMDVALDQFTLTRSAPEYQEGLRAFFGRVLTHAAVTVGETPALFDGGTGAYLYEVDVGGRCPHCGSGCGGNICEECGMPNLVVDLDEPRSRLSEAPPRVGALTRPAIDLGRAGEAIRAHQARARVPARIRALTDAVIAAAPAVPLTHPAAWGVAPTQDEEGRLVIWVWPEMAYGFLYGIEAVGRRAGRDWDKLAPKDDWKIVHFFGYDNSFYHAILYPALYAAAYPDWTPDIDYHYNEFYLLDGLKFSTSRRHAIWGKEILDESSVDAVRLYLSLTRGEVSRTNFSRADFDRFVSETLIGSWQSWLRDVGAIVERDFDGRAPDAGDWTPEQTAFLGDLEETRRALGRLLGARSFSLNRACARLDDLVTTSRRYMDSQAHLRGRPAQADRWRTAVALQLAAARLLADAAAALAPRFSAALAEALGLEGATRWPDAARLVPYGSAIALARAAFFMPIGDASPVSVATRTPEAAE
ncbi:class I tRNA ligase family protein [Salinarimonas sp.]|uniref:class I tRNA ligase family protein n=1 Tax=Salinarimonas sp. TaxID=2766526 RepID=UPI0032D91507